MLQVKIELVAPGVGDSFVLWVAVYCALGFAVLGEALFPERNSLDFAGVEKYCVRKSWGLRVSCVLIFLSDLRLPVTVYGFVSAGVGIGRQLCIMSPGCWWKGLRDRGSMYAPVAVNVMSQLF